MKRKMLPALSLIFTMFLPHCVNAWNETGHQLVARIAWEQMNETARAKAIALLQGGPQRGCLVELEPTAGSPQDRARGFFVVASTWPDIVRPRDRPAKAGRPAFVDTRECKKFHRQPWHFINFFWKGTSGATGANRPRDLTAQELKRIQISDVNAVMLLSLFEPFVACDKPHCGTSTADRATTLAWILHLVGDIHQPLHTSARVTGTPPKGDQGGNLCKLSKASKSSLHSFWDGIIDLKLPQTPNESDPAYIERVAQSIMQEHPRAEVSSRLRPFNFEAWSREGLETTKSAVYPVGLRCGPTATPSDDYRNSAFTVSKRAIALAGYRLAELLNQMLGS